MAISLASLTRGAEVKPPRILIYGVQGIGKTTLIANAPAPVVIQTEDGLGTLDVPAFPLAKSYNEVMEALGSLASDKHEFKTLGIDSLDWLEPLVQQHACRANNWATIEDPGYGKGYVAAMGFWREYVDAINYLRDTVGMTIIQTAHSQIKRFDSPETDPYDRYEIKLHKQAGALLMEHSDCVLFANYRMATTKADAGFNKKVTRAVGSGERMINTEERPAFSAKNRYGMPAQVSMSKENPFDQIAAHIPFFSTQA